MEGKATATLPIAPNPRTFPIKRRAENADVIDDSPSCADGAGILAMTDTKLLLQKIAALRTRLDTGTEATTKADPVGAVEEKVQDMATSASQLAGKVKDTAEEWASSVGGAAVQAKDKAHEVAGAAA